jgi:RNA polymerase primary sigma factor
VKEITTNKNILTENSELLQKYFKDISKYPIYSSEEQVELAKKIKEGDDKARQKLINSNLRFVVTCAKQFVGQGVPLMDLINSGNLGLVQSIEKYDPSKGFHFISYAVWYIRREIIKSIYNTGRTIRYPITYIAIITKVKKAFDDFVNKNQRNPTDEELIKASGITEKQYNSVILNKSYCQSIDTPVTDDGKSTIEDLLSEEVKPLSDVFTKEAVSNSLKVLNPREYKVITEYYGLEGKSERTIKEIAKEMNLGDERIRQLRKEAIKKLERRCGKTLKTLL